MLKKQDSKQAKRESLGGASKSSRLKGIGANRNKEKMINRKYEYIELDKKSNNQEGKVLYINSEEDDDLTDEFNLIKKLQKERFHE